MKQFVTIGLLVLMLGLACNEPFEPKGPFQKKMVVYGILNPQSDTQYVRVYSTYDPPGFDPLAVGEDTPVLDAQVMISFGGVAVQLHDTTVARDDSSRYTTGIHTFVAHPFTANSGEAYSLTVQSPTLGSASAVTTVPGHGFLTIGNPAILSSPSTFPNDDIVLTISPSQGTRGYLLRFFVEYEIQTAGKPLGQIEVPQSSQGYARLTRIGGTSARTTFSRDTYVTTIQSVISAYGVNGIRFTRAIFYLLEVDNPLYNYYNVANGFQDNYSIRTDQPDYTNINGGVGVFGSFAVDTVVAGLSPQIR
ncbi:MAG: DUF4249 family protein [Bacteroidota bacterium]